VVIRARCSSDDIREAVAIDISCTGGGGTEVVLSMTTEDLYLCCIDEDLIGGQTSIRCKDKSGNCQIDCNYSQYTRGHNTTPNYRLTTRSE
ncbi:MAG: hypothetical protein AAEJ46_04030, partial [Planctomycetota bacterium]